MKSIPPYFSDPPWDTELDTASAVRAIPETATVAGMFLAAVAGDARQARVNLPTLRDRYIPFSFYPMREHAQVLLEACAHFFPSLSARQALRKVGRGTPRALTASTLGRVVFGSAQGATELFESLIKTYPIGVRPCRAEVLESSAGRMVIRLEDVHLFLDSHHVGVFEGVLRYARVRGKVQIRAHSPTSADFLCTWQIDRSSAAKFGDRPT